MLERYFQLSAHGTTVKTELLAALYAWFFLRRKKTA